MTVDMAVYLGAERLGAFVPGTRTVVPPTAGGPLDGLRFAVKDLIDVAGVTTGGGNPDWLATHSPAVTHAPAVARLLAAGAAVDGKVITDELAYSLEGENAHYGTPLNPRWPHALPGGSSSGSASAVAGGAVDFALGTDTGGSVRVPAAFCGLWGMRPSHDHVSTEGVLPFSPCFDTVGWFARDGATFAVVGDVLLPPAPAAVAGKRLALFGEAFAARARSEPDDAGRLRALARQLGATDSVDVFNGERDRWLHCYQQLQDGDIATALGGWIRATRPNFGPSIAARFARLDALDSAEVARQRAQREALRPRIDALLADTVLVLPTTPLALLARDAPPDVVDGFYRDALNMNALAALGGLPQITIPFSDGRDRPLALSIIGARGEDRALIAVARALYARRPGG